LIYLNEGPIALNEHGIAGRCKQSIRTFRTALRILLDLDKLTLSDGRLANFRAGKELENVAENRVNAGKGGKKSAEVRNSQPKPLKNNASPQASLQEDRSLKEKTREEEKREEEKKDPPLRVVDDWPSDYGDQFWQAYPRKTEKLEAMKRLSKVRKSGLVTFTDLIAGVRRYAKAVSKNDPQFTKQPSVWLNKGCWADETMPGESKNGQRTGNSRASGHDALLAVATGKARELDRDDTMAGPDAAVGFAFGDGTDGSRSQGNPGSPGCDQRDHHWFESDPQGVREGEIIPPDKNVVGLSGRR
jgi:hypothetical protein